MGITVVTGASGHVGVNLVPTLLQRGDRVRVVDTRLDPMLAAWGVEWCPVDVCDGEAVARALDGSEVVYHLAALISVVGGMAGRVERVNVGGVATVAAAARRAGVRRLVHCSSVHAYDTAAMRHLLLDERAPKAARRSLPAYDRSKAAGERALQAEVARGLDAVVCNPSGILGPRDPAPSRMGRFFLALRARRVPALVEGGFDWVDVRDVVDALVVAAEKGRVGENYLLGGRAASVRSLAETASGVTGVPAPLVTLPMWFARIWSPAATSVARRTADPLLYTADTLHALDTFPHVDPAKAQAELGFDPRPLAETIADLYAWFDRTGVDPAAVSWTPAARVIP